MKTVATKAVEVSKKLMTSDDPITAYATKQFPSFEAICQALRREIDTALPQATSKLWHAMPVWFVETNPVVGYKATPKHVNLLFWNGQSFGEPDLKAAGKFKAAQIQFKDVSEIHIESLRRWLRKSGMNIWDYQGLPGKRKLVLGGK